MPVRQPPVTDIAVRVLLDSIVDYAGLYPPSSTGMAAAVRNYAHYRAGESGWMLGRFVCPADSLELFSKEAELYLPRDAGAIAWQLSVTASSDVARDADAIAAFNECHRVCFDECCATIDAYEVKAMSVEDVIRVHDELPPTLRTFIEVPLASDPEPMLQAIAHHGRLAKMRTGGTTPEAFPASVDIARFLAACARCKVAAKATAGLHHPFRNAYRLTYENDAQQGMMFGYVNVFLAAALVRCEAPEHDVVALLEEQKAGNVTFDNTHCYWSGGSEPYAFHRAFLSLARERNLVSFGSCSFVEPVGETRALGWL